MVDIDFEGIIRKHKIEERDLKIAAEHFSLGKEAFEKKDYIKATEYFNVACTFDPNKEYFRKRADSLYEAIKQKRKKLKKETNIDAIIEDFKETIEVDPDYSKHHFLLADALFYKWINKNSSRKIEEPSELKPDIGASHHNPSYNYGVSAPDKDSKREIEQALWEYEESIRLDPNNFLSYYMLGLIWLDSHEYQEAIPNLKAAIKLESENSDLYYYLGVAYEIGSFWSGKKFDGEKEFREAIRLDKEGHANYHYELALILTKKGEKEEAAKELEEVVRLDSSNSEYQFKLGEELLEIGEPHKAVSALKEAIRLDYNKRKYHIRMGDALIRIGKSQEGCEEYEIAKNLPDNI